MYSRDTVYVADAERANSRRIQVVEPVLHDKLDAAIGRLAQAWTDSLASWPGYLAQPVCLNGQEVVGHVVDRDLKTVVTRAIASKMRLTQPAQSPQADDGTGQGQKRHMGRDAALEADPELAEGRQPRMRALDHPAMTAQTLLALDALAGDTHPDAPPPQMLAAAFAVVGFVRMELVGPAPGPAGLALDRGQRIDHLLEHHRVMPVRTRDAEHHRRAVGVGQHMALGAEFAPVGRVRSGVRTPRGLATLEPSMHMRL